MGHTVRLVTDGNQVLEALDKETFDLIFMDCQMPSMDGYETTSTIRQRESGGRHTPIIALTAHAMEGARQKCLDAGMDGYLSKPIQANPLYETLENMLAVRPGLSTERQT